MVTSISTFTCFVTILIVFYFSLGFRGKGCLGALIVVFKAIMTITTGKSRRRSSISRRRKEEEE